jgi:hypothetical protein
MVPVGMRLHCSNFFFMFVVIPPSLFAHLKRLLNYTAVETVFAYAVLPRAAHGRDI